MFEHEKLEVYRLSRELNREICRLTKMAGKGAYDHLDQLVRSGSSMSRNIAEASGEWAPKEKAKFYRYAKRSACEVAAALDVLVDYQMLRESDTQPAKELLQRIIPMLVKLIQLFERGAPNRPIKNPMPSPRTDQPKPIDDAFPEALARARAPKNPGPGPGPQPAPGDRPATAGRSQIFPE